MKARPRDNMACIKLIFKSAAYRWGGGWLARRRHPGALRILMFHRFSNAGRFDAQCAYLLRHYRPLSLTEAANALQDGCELPPRSVVITVDDGYADFYLAAYPILRRYGLSAIVYLATDMLDRGEPLWNDRPEFRSPSGIALKQALKRMPNAERLSALAAIKPRDGDLPRENQPLTWDQVREMNRHSIDFGAHTRSHPILSRIGSKSELHDEIAGSKKRIEEELQRQVFHFCYPNGHRADYTPAVIDIVKNSGFFTAVTGQAGINHPGQDRFELLRIAEEPEYDEASFAVRLGGLRT